MLLSENLSCCVFVVRIVPEITTFGAIKSVLENESNQNVFVFPVVDAGSLLTEEPRLGPNLSFPNTHRA